jgi:hypothetical protein
VNYTFANLKNEEREIPPFLFNSSRAYWRTSSPERGGLLEKYPFNGKGRALCFVFWREGLLERGGLSGRKECVGSSNCSVCVHVDMFTWTDSTILSPVRDIM